MDTGLNVAEAIAICVIVCAFLLFLYAILKKA